MSGRDLSRIARAAVVPISLLIAYLSLKPAEPDPNGGYGLLRWLAEQLLGDPGQDDKIGHFLAYAALSDTAALGFPRRTALVVALSFLYGAGFEVLQGLTPGRTPSLADLLANGLGVVTGLLAALALGRLSSGDNR